MQVLEFNGNEQDEWAIGIMAKEIQLTRGQVAIVDDDDYESLSKYKWQAHKRLTTWYAKRTAWPSRKVIFMHIAIMNPPKGLEVDHRDGNGLNNTKSNLRICTHAQNMLNSSKPITNTSGYIGVYWNKQSRKWQAYISINNKSKYLGQFDDPESAARAHDAKATEVRGEFAKTNFPY